MINNKIVVIIGPTATNKTKLAISIAKEINGEIINADAFQVYKQLNVGVNKPTTEQLREIKFHLVNNINIDDKWDIKRFQETANKVIKQIYIENKIPIIVGGSHLYVDALIKNYDLSSFNERDNQFADLSTQELYERLKILDQGKAVSIINNRQRLLRALQIYTQTPSKLTPMRNKNKSIYNALIIECSNERQLIYNRVNKRIDDMLDNGWIDEVAKLIISYKNVNDLSAFKAIGYSEIYHSLLEHKKLDVDKIKQRTRQYVKRQLTWIKHHYTSQIVFSQTNYGEILKQVKTWLIS